mmetsp:Transcript_18661/g.17766  ORF Transcript_18661/g.17766 Transcript_18661/m.17766 type:complete len:81 (-) Transcript_18661:679-921(-)
MEEELVNTSPLKRMKTTNDEKESMSSLKSLQDDENGQDANSEEKNDKLSPREKIKRKIAISNLNIKDITLQSEIQNNPLK